MQEQRDGRATSRSPNLIFGWWRVLVNAPPFARFSQHNTEIVYVALNGIVPPHSPSKKLSRWIP
jgi:hypothetical protein